MGCRDTYAMHTQCQAVPFYRWQHSGDLQDVGHLRKIVQVCELTPAVTHWLPTREYKIVAAYRKIYGEFPENLTVRQSAHMLDDPPPSGYGLPTSTVVTDGSETCPAPTQGGKCLKCRACWSRDTANVSYKYH